MRCRIEATSAGTLKAEVDNSSSTTIHKEEDLLQLKWEATMGSKFTIVVNFNRILYIYYNVHLLHDLLGAIHKWSLLYNIFWPTDCYVLIWKQKQTNLVNSVCTNFLKFSPLSLILKIARLRKPDASSGLGISLEGTVDVEDGKEVRPHHYIRSILPGGPIGLNGVLKSGDELLEVSLSSTMMTQQFLFY